MAIMWTTSTNHVIKSTKCNQSLYITLQDCYQIIWRKNYHVLIMFYKVSPQTEHIRIIINHLWQVLVTDYLWGLFHYKLLTKISILSLDSIDDCFRNICPMLRNYGLIYFFWFRWWCLYKNVNQPFSTSLCNYTSCFFHSLSESVNSFVEVHCVRENPDFLPKSHENQLNWIRQIHLLLSQSWKKLVYM